MRALRYFLAGFETLVALFFSCLFAGGSYSDHSAQRPKERALGGREEGRRCVRIGSSDGHIGDGRGFCFLDGTMCYKKFP